MAGIKMDNQYISYVLEDNNSFFLTGYKVINKQKNMGLIPCRKVMFNGHIKLLYAVSKLVSVASMVESWDVSDTLIYMRKLAQSISAIKENGFLQLETVELDISRIFIDLSTGDVALISLPVMSGEYCMSNAIWCQVLKKTFLSIIELSGQSNTSVLRHLKTSILECTQLPEGIFAVVVRFMRQEKEIFNTEKLKHIEKLKQENIYLISNNTSKRLSILIDRDEFVLGKNVSVVDGVVDLSNTISRIHCKIVRKESNFYVQDLNSSNHTYVNGRLLVGEELVKIQPGDVVRMAEIEFLVKSAEEKLE